MQERSKNNSAPAGATSGFRIGTSRRGFAGMDPAKQREIASKGGKAAHATRNAHKWTAEEAREAGRKGGRVSQSPRA